MPASRLAILSAFALHRKLLSFPVNPRHAGAL
jgi:hypothetical protein